MKKILLFVFTLSLVSCYKLDLDPLSEGSSGNWYTNEDELTMAVRSLYNTEFWILDDDAFTDDWTNRTEVNGITGGTIDGLSSAAASLWSNSYTAIGRANEILRNLPKATENGVSENLIRRFEGEAKFARAVQNSRLITHYGDIVYVPSTISTVEEAFEMGRTDKNEVLQHVYSDFDDAIELLDIEYAGEQRANKGAAYAFKARTALYLGDFDIAAEAAQKCIELGIYGLHNSFAQLFVTSTKSSDEFIFVRPRSMEYNARFVTRAYVPRISGGFGQYTPSWELFCAFLCSDGKAIDESSLFDPKEPFKNRDPRLNATIVEFGTRHLGYDYDPSPRATTVHNYNTGTQVANQDTRSVDQYASYNGLLWKKWIDDSWIQNSFRSEKSEIIMRYADVLLMYAEAKIEIGEVDQTVLDAINDVRARAYGVGAGQQYPSVTTTDINELRRIVRTERRMEFAFEGLRYMDIIRWRLAEKVLNKPIYGMLDPVELEEEIIQKGLWFFPQVPPIDEDGVADFSDMYEMGQVKLLVERRFDERRQYLFPIPSNEVLINEKIKPNPGY